MTKLSDMQLILLTAASQREDGNLLPVPESISAAGARLQKALAGLLKRSMIAEHQTTAPGTSWREDGDARFGLAINDTGRAAIGILPQAKAADQDEGRLDAGDGGSGPTPFSSDAPAAGAVVARPGSKQATVITLLQHQSGASITELAKATGWLPHTTRAALTGLRQRGLQIQKEKVDGATRYRAPVGAAA